MVMQVGVVTSIRGLVKALDPQTGIERILTVGSPVYQGEMLQTAEASQVLVTMKSGELVNLGRLTSITIDEDVINDKDPKTEMTAKMAALEKAIADGTLEGIDLDDLEAVAAGEEPESANEGGIVIARLG
ncbi:MAG: retention module-containing protein, partial [Thiotrichales bacterium]|nr:retention module-containing protein [Thiotrichales bacterium]